MSQQDTYRFQVNLSGMINILSNHLYSHPKVYIRELLQNAVDAITARRALDPDHRGSVTVEVSAGHDVPTLTLEDNGVGLNEAEVHEFLAMIGQSSKRGVDFVAEETSFIGRFGIGLLSCFMVSDEIVMLTQSAKGGPSLEWRGKPDGTYTIRTLDTPLAPGTKVYLRCKRNCESFFDPDNLKKWMYEYGALLPFPITLQSGVSSAVINRERPDWLADPGLARGRRDEVLAMGEALLGEKFRDFITLKTASGRTGGIAYILPHAVSLNAKKSHRVYLKHMLVSEKAGNILPEWAFFVKCVVWTDELQPTASREDFYENERLDEVRTELGEAIRAEIMRMADYEPDRLQHLIRLHALSMKALAVEDESFYRIIHRWLPFETTFGRKELGELIKEHEELYYTVSLDEYRQITHVAAAQTMLVINGGYVYDAELLERLAYVEPSIRTRRLLPEDVSLSFTDITPDERRSYYNLTRTADASLQRFRCQVQLKRFMPADLPALYTLSKESSDLRALEAAEEVSTDVLSSVLNSLGNAYKEAAYSTLYLNLDNPIVSRVFETNDEALLAMTVEMLYVNALMMGHYPMNKQELASLNRGILRFLEWGLAAGDLRQGGTGQ